MTILRGFGIVITSILLFGIGGAATGYGLAITMPGYYKGVFRATDKEDFRPTDVGIGLGLSQGMMAGALIGCVIVLSVAWYRSRAIMQRTSN